MSEQTDYESRFNVLLLEDSPEDVIMYKRHLDAMPGVFFNIQETGSVQQAKDILQGNDFDCYVIDYNLPDSNGLDFVRYLLNEKAEHGEKAAIIIVTGQGSEEIAAESFKLGADEYLTKRSISDGFFGRPVLNAIERSQLTAQIQHFQDRLAQSNKDLSDFTHTAAHDLKSPLRRISSYCEILAEDAADRLNDEDKTILDRMQVNAQRMQNLINSLLSYSMIEYDEEEKQQTDLKQIAEETINELKETIDETAARVDVGDLPVINAYPVRMKQVLTNLVYNALKYKSSEPPYIVIDCVENDDKKITLSVKDNGQGIPQDHQDMIFKDFKRLHSNEEVEGSGLGLSICRKIIERHGGKIWVESEPGKGSTFFFTLKTK